MFSWAEGPDPVIVVWSARSERTIDHSTMRERCR